MLLAASIAAAPIAPAGEADCSIDHLWVTAGHTVLVDDDAGDIACWLDSAEPGTAYGRIAVSYDIAADVIVVVITPAS